MYLRFNRVTAKGHDYEYVQICRSVRVGGKIRRKVVANLGRRDELDVTEVDALIQNLRRLASPEVQVQRPLTELELVEAKDYLLAALAAGGTGRVLGRRV